jgi:hypothetical protein
MRNKDTLLHRLKTNPIETGQLEAGLDVGGEEVERSYTYSVAAICLPEGTGAYSMYVIGGNYGYFREDNCGSKAAGSLTFVAEATLEDADFGTFEGWIYNSKLARPARSYFFSKNEAFPDDLPGMYLVCEGKPYKKGDPVTYDAFSGFGATRS